MYSYNYVLSINIEGKNVGLLRYKGSLISQVNNEMFDIILTIT